MVIVALASLLASCGDPEPDATTTETISAAAGGDATTTEPIATNSTGAEQTTAAASADIDGELYPDVVDAVAKLGADGTWEVSATLSSPYDSPDRYADAWRVVGPDGSVYGIRELAHDHAAEQPFTRSLSGVAVPDDVDQVVVEGRDQISGWGGTSFTIQLNR